LAAPYIAAQGKILGRRGRVHIDDDNDAIWVGGDTTITVSGVIDV